jgi:uncharacterized protein (TIGR02266 family)
MLLPIDVIRRAAGGGEPPGGGGRPFRVTFRSPEEFAREFDDNLRNMGLFVPTYESRAVRDVVAFVVVVPGTGEEIAGTGEVIYQIEVADARERGRRPGRGLQVLQFDMAAAARARQAIRETQAEAILRPPEQRVAVRIPARLRVRYRTRAEFQEGLTRDISLGGVFLRTEEPYPVGTAIQVTFVRPLDGREMVVQGEVARTPLVTAENGPVIGMGVRFLELTPQKRLDLDRFVRYVDLRRRAQTAQELRGRVQDTGVESVIHVCCEADRDGELILRRGGEAGRIEFKGSRIVRAELPDRGVRGERAFFRMMTWDAGEFEYRPRAVEPAGDLDREGRGMVREGLRVRTEVGEWARSLPADRRLRPGPALDRAQPPAAAKPVLDLLPQRPTVAEILDRVGRNDLEAYRILGHLRQRGLVDLG